MKIFKISKMSVPAALLLSALIIGLSIFITVWVFFGGAGNRQKLWTSTPTNQKAPTPPSMTPEQLKKIQEQRAAQLKQQQEAKQTATSTE